MNIFRYWCLCAMAALLSVWPMREYAQQALPFIKPAAAGYSGAFFPALCRRMNDSIPSLGSLLVWRHQGLVCEQYFHGADSSTAFDIKSITKSIMSALAGIALRDGMLPSLDSRVMDFFPEYNHSRHAPGVWFANEKEYHDSLRNKLTIHDILSMQPGIEWSDFGPVVNAFINASEPVRFVLELPFERPPGQHFVYCSGAASVFAALLSKRLPAGYDLRRYANEKLFAATGMQLSRWDKDPSGLYLGASEMYMTSRSLARFGVLYLHGGRVGDRQVIPADWIKKSTSEQAHLHYWDVIPHVNGYGYYWWRRRTNGHQAWIASGAQGQLIGVVPDLDLVVVANCLLNESNRGREEIRQLQQYLDQITAASR